VNVPIPKLAGVCGWPIHHSLSPEIHNLWLKKSGLAGAYVRFAVHPDEAIPAFRSLLQTSIVGVNVTLPLKQIAFEVADEVSADAEKLGVSNCLYKKNGQLIAHNTDMEGFINPLLKKFGIDNIRNNSVLVIGTGGASRAVIGALLSLNAPEIRLCGRQNEMARRIVDEIFVHNLYAVSWAQRHQAVQTSGLIINASSGGMSGKAPVDVDLHNTRAFIYDLVYTPLITPLLQQAKKLELDYLGGLDMLIAQARPSFRLFFGKTPPRTDDVKTNLMEILQNRQTM